MAGRTPRFAPATLSEAATRCVLQSEPPVRAVFVLLLLFSVGAAAQSAPEPDAPPPSSRLWLTGGVALRHFEQPYEGPGVIVQGLAPTTLHASGAVFFSRWLGLDVEARGGLVYASNNGAKVPLGSLGVAALPAFRLSPGAMIDLEAQLGWGVTGRPALSLADPAAPTGRLRLSTGPAAALVVGLEPAPWLSAQLFARTELAVGNAVGVGVNAGAQLRLGALRLGDTRWGVGVSYELAFARLGAGAGELLQLEHRFGLGVAMLARPAPPMPVLPPPLPAATTARLVGRVLVAGKDVPVPGAVVEVSERGAVTADAQGRFVLVDLAPGAATVSAIAKGFKGASREVTLRAGDDATVELELAPPKGPGRVVGVVQAAPDKPLLGVLVRADGGAEVKTDERGAFTLERVGPGPVTITAALTGFEKGEEVVQVPPEASASLTFTLKATGVRAKATVKGLVLGADGAVPKATVKLLEKKLTVKLKPDGRFELEVPGGRYTISIQAPGYVTQTKVLELADGDQAIFHAELEKTR